MSIPPWADQELLAEQEERDQLLREGKVTERDWLIATLHTSMAQYQQRIKALEAALAAAETGRTREQRDGVTMDKQQEAIEHIRRETRNLEMSGHYVPLEVRRFLDTHPEQTQLAALLAEMERHRQAVMHILGFDADAEPTQTPT